ncbi:hypothetical protein PV332_15005 [Streptomyces scabiei]|uniref:hypothetical protein n=1 Tax=Streptomyces scabiei TaxID=1930 RepID=UPI0029B0AD79|nr:hypothetical protein [Streptomyces scabiei]MDX2576781.1 hypothetical protein [Streptomyces scabiei]MDX3027107.1 hypothetical protein [Streptomyces scabiei]MDX3204846.1 hypothetical protein [Streptomyces scabiei]
MRTIKSGTEALRATGRAEVRIVAASPETYRAVAEALRHCIAGTEQRSYPAPGGGPRLHLTVATETPAGPARSWLTSSRSPLGSRTESHADGDLTAMTSRPHGRSAPAVAGCDMPLLA